MSILTDKMFELMAKDLIKGKRVFVPMERTNSKEDMIDFVKTKYALKALGEIREMNERGSAQCSK